MTGADIVGILPAFRGRLLRDAPLAPFTWFRVGGPAEVLASPADEDDLAYLLAALPHEVPVIVIGLGSNLIVRDGGVPGVVVRLGGRAFNFVDFAEEGCVRAGAAALDAQVARACAENNLAGLAFLRGVPGSIGGALRMNAGAHGGDMASCLIEARGFERTGARRTLARDDMGYSYRHSEVHDGFIFVGCNLRGQPGERSAIEAEMARITALREASQPIREKTGGSTFKNPPGRKAWELIDAAGCRGLTVGDAQVSPMHCNFLINRGAATASDIERLGEEVRSRVFERGGVDLEWEIKRIGVPLPPPA